MSQPVLNKKQRLFCIIIYSTFACFYTTFQEYIKVLQDDLFEQDSRSIIASCELLKTITNDINPDKRLKQELKRESAIMLTSLRMHVKARRKVYTPLQILLKLEILFERILDHSRICHDTYAELKNTIVKTKDEELLESIVLRERKKRPMFLREITDAILDDIIDFLQKQNKTFYDFYNDYRISYIVFRLENYADYLETSIYVYDKLCVFISKDFTDKYKLDRKCLAQLIRDQFENTDQSVYRMKLTDFVDKFTNECFTFDKFFEYIQEESVLTKEEEKIYALLFEIYCKKLSGLLPTAPSQTPPASPRNSFSNDQVPTSTTKQSFRQKKPRKDQRITTGVESQDFPHDHEQRIQRRRKNYTENTDDSYFLNSDHHNQPQFSDYKSSYRAKDKSYRSYNSSYEQQKNTSDNY